MAKLDVIMPQMGESIAEGTISRWMKKVGDPVKRDEPIFEISTDKVDAEIPAPGAGVLAEIIVGEGQTVAVNTVVARIETDATAAVSPSAPPATDVAARPQVVEPTPAAPSPRPAPSPATKATPAPAKAAPAAATAPAVAPAPASRSVPDSTGNGGAGGETAEERLKRKSTPLVRKIAAEHNIDIAAVPGSGSAGRVTKDDILGFIERGTGAGEQGAVIDRPAADASARAAASIPSVPTVPAVPSAPHVEPWEGDRVEPWSRIRKLTADHMVMSRRVSPHVNTLFEVDYTRIAQIRGRKKAEYAERGVNLTFLSFIVKAVADSLRQHPGVNAAVKGESTIFRRDINIGIAVALDWGLIVPVIRHADELALLGVARAIQDLAERARIRKLLPEEVQRGTFTITNPGVFGSVIGIPIINQPQAAIMAVGSIAKQPAVVAGPDGTDLLGIRTRGMLCLAFDHRIVDGADADRFMADVKKSLEDYPESAV